MAIVFPYNRHFWKAFVIASLFFAVCSPTCLRAQAWPFELWHEGKMVLTTGDTLRGMLKYDLQQDLVQYTVNNGAPDAFTARKVLFFEIFDTSSSRYRRFFALPYASSPGYKTPVFFELLEEGKMTLLAREFLEYRNSGSMYVNTRLILSHKYFFMKENGDIEEFTGSRSDLLDMMGRQADKVEKFIRANRLRFEYKEDFARIIDYYNSLF
ncbi:MAG TPA: hypothetical protein VGD65_11725 [Chryseosolibacter sp.]